MKTNHCKLSTKRRIIENIDYNNDLIKKSIHYLKDLQDKQNSEISIM